MPRKRKPGRPKGSKNKPGHKAGRPKKKGGNAVTLSGMHKGTRIVITGTIRKK